MSVFDQHRVRGKCEQEVPGRLRRSRISEKNGVWGFWGSTNGNTWWK